MGKIRLAMFVSSLCNGGIERVVINILENINTEIFEVYIFLLSDQDMYYQERVLQSGAAIITDYPQLMRSSRGNKRWELFNSTEAFLRKFAIDVVHIHCNNESPEIILACKKNHISNICMHAHVAYSKYWNPNSFSLKSMLAKPIFSYIQNMATYKLGCSQAACEYMFGLGQNTEVIYNALDFNKFNVLAYESKSHLQEKYGLSSTNDNIIFVGRLEEQKNPLFMLDVLKELILLNERARLIIVGYGVLETGMRNKVEELQLTKYVNFLPHNSNVPELLKASDFFLSPSTHEGLGIVFVEAQAMEIPAFASDAVPQEADLGLCEFIPLSLGAVGYASKMFERMESYKQNADANKQIDKARLDNYRMEKMIKRLETIYSSNL